MAQPVVFYHERRPVLRRDNNQLFLEQPLSVRFGIIAVVLVITGVCLLMYGFLLHGILCTMGALAGDAVG